jgi:tricorn protease
MNAVAARQRGPSRNRHGLVGSLAIVAVITGALVTPASAHVSAGVVPPMAMPAATPAMQHSAAFATIADRAWSRQQTDGSVAFARDPHYHNGRVVFSLRGNLWVVNADGSGPVQLTRTPSRDFSPRWSPDGQWIAFTSDRMGNNDVFIMPATGGDPRQLTFHSGSDNVEYWTPDGQRIVFSSSRGPYSWESPLYTVSREGGLPVMIPMGAGASGMYSQDGRMLAFNRISYPDPRRNYRGARTASVWVKDVQANTFRQLTNTVLEESQQHIHDAHPMWGADGWIYFMSERSGIFNIWRIRPQGGEPEQVTRHTRGGIRFPAISADGRTLTYSQEFELWVLQLGQTEPRRLPLALGYTIDRELFEIVSTENTADSFSPSPDGRFLAVDFRGEVFIVPAEAGVGERRRITDSAWRQGGAMYSPDGRYVAYLSDETREEEVWVHDLRTGQKRQLTRHPSKKNIEIWSPDSRTVYWQADQRIYASDIDGSPAREIKETRSAVLPPELYRPRIFITDISPDGRWLLSHRGTAPVGFDRESADVFLFDVQEGREYNVTSHAGRNTHGFFSPDGSRVFFVSDRDNGTSHLFSVALAFPTENPNDPVVRERLAREAARENRDAPEFRVSVDVRRIADRAVQLTTGSDGVSSPFPAADGRTIYFLAGTGSGRGLFAINPDGTNRRRIVEGAFNGMVVSGDRRTVFFRENNGISRMPLASREKAPVRFTLSFTVDKREEWRQMFDEFYRHWKYSYVEPDFLGVDFTAVRDRLAPAVEKVGSTDDFYMLASEMAFSARSSHTGVSAPNEPDGRIGGRSQTRHPGFELEPRDGGLQVTYIYRHGPAAEPWLDLREGEYVLALDGVPVSANTNYWELLTGRLNDFVTVTVAPRPNAPAAQRRELRIETVGNIANVRYEDFVTRSREFVDSVSGGRVAYFHMRSMNQGTLDRLLYEMDQYSHKEAMILDVRYNGGGNIERQLIDVLQRQPFQIMYTRDGSAPGGGRRPHQLIHGPKVMMHNHRSGSNAEMAPQAFKHNAIGPTVGTPTAGAVSSASSFGLLDGGSVRFPRIGVVAYDPTQPLNIGVNLENYGVPPDIYVRNTPEEELRRFDRELLVALEEVMRLLQTGRWQFVGGNGDAGN